MLLFNPYLVWRLGGSYICCSQKLYLWFLFSVFSKQEDYQNFVLLSQTPTQTSVLLTVPFCCQFKNLTRNCIYWKNIITNQLYTLIHYQMFQCKTYCKRSFFSMCFILYFICTTNAICTAPQASTVSLNILTLTNKHFCLSSSVWLWVFFLIEMMPSTDFSSSHPFNIINHTLTSSS